jgi:hypothetical protein
MGTKYDGGNEERKKMWGNPFVNKRVSPHPFPKNFEEGKVI